MTVKTLSASLLVLVLLSGASAKGARPFKPFSPPPVPQTCPASDLLCW